MHEVSEPPSLPTALRVFSFGVWHMNMYDKQYVKGFTLLETTLVVFIMALVAAIAIPRYATAADGRKVMVAKRLLLNDVEYAKRLARHSSSEYVMAFYPGVNAYTISTGTTVDSSTVILRRDFDNDPINVSILRTDLGTPEAFVITAFGDVTPGCTVDLGAGSSSIHVVIDGVSDVTITPTVNLTGSDVDAMSVSSDTINMLP